jgi:hypothetical protein
MSVERDVGRTYGHSVDGSRNREWNMTFECDSLPRRFVSNSGVRIEWKKQQNFYKIGPVLRDLNHGLPSFGFIRDGD